MDNGGPIYEKDFYFYDGNKQIGEVNKEYFK